MKKMNTYKYKSTPKVQHASGKETEHFYINTLLAIHPYIYMCMYMYIYIQSCSVRSSVLCLSKEDRQITHGNTVKCKGITFFGTQFYSAAFAFTL